MRGQPSDLCSSPGPSASEEGALLKPETVPGRLIWAGGPQAQALVSPYIFYVYFLTFKIAVTRT